MQKLKNNEARPKFTGIKKACIHASPYTVDKKPRTFKTFVYHQVRLDDLLVKLKINLF